MSRKFLIVESHPSSLAQGLVSLGFQVDEFPKITYKNIYEIIPEYTGIVISSRLRIDRTFLNHAKKLKFILRPGSGMENVDMHYANELGIRCINSPEGNRDAVAEHAIGMLLNLLNNIQRASTEVRNGVWLRENNRGIELKGKTIGIIGYGNTGKAIAKKLSGFDVQCLAYDKYTYSGNEFVRHADMKEIFEKADIVSFHLPLTSETKHFANDQFFRNFRKAIYIINTSRGEVIKTSSLINAIERGAVVGACLDVLENEKLYLLNPRQQKEFIFLQKNHNVILTPHIAGWSDASKKRMISTLLEKFAKVKNHTLFSTSSSL